MIFPKLFSEQIRTVEANPNATRSNKTVEPLHLAIAKIVSEQTDYKVISLPDKEYLYENDMGSKKIDIAIVDDQNNLKAAILFKSVKSEYNKNANNYYEIMKGESEMFMYDNIPVYQIIFIPTSVRHKNSKGEKVFETPSAKSYNHYCSFIAKKQPFWDKLKLGVFYFDIDYEYEYETFYSGQTIPGVEDTLTEGLINFMKGVK